MQTLKKGFDTLLKEAVDKCVENARRYDTARALKGIPTHHQADLIQRFTHLKDEEFFNQRKVIYTKILKDIFLPNGKMIEPVAKNKEKQRLAIGGPFASGVSTLLRQLKKGDFTDVENVQNIFRKISKNAAIIDISHIRSQLPEYKAAASDKYPYATSIVRAEVASIDDAAVDLARELNLNIIGTAGSFHSALKDDEAIDNFAKGGYELSFVGITSDPDRILKWSREKFEEKGFLIPEPQIVESINGFADDNAFRKLMRYSKDASLLWRDENKEFTCVAESKDGELKVNSHTKWMKFKEQQFFSVEKDGISI